MILPALHPPRQHTPIPSHRMHKAATELALTLPDLAIATHQTRDQALALLDPDNAADHEASAMALHDAAANLREAIQATSLALDLLTPLEHREFVIPDVPLSNNRNEVRSHWRPSHRNKREWQAAFVRELYVLDIPRPVPSLLTVDVELTFPTHRRRDIENYRGISKPLGDALVGPRHKDPGRDRKLFHNGAGYVCGWLTDDTAAHWTLHLTENPDTGPAATRVRLSWRQPVVATSAVAGA